MIVFSVAIPVDAPEKVFDLVRGFFAFLRGMLGIHEDRAVFSETEGSKDEPQN